MEKSSKRGKIPQQDWPSIITRYEAGETLASIARTYDCSPPAISYIVSRTRARGAAGGAIGQVPPPATESQLVKGPGPETSINGIAADGAPHSRPTVGEHQALGAPLGEPRLIEQAPDTPPAPERQLFADQPQPSQIRERGRWTTESTPAPREGQKQSGQQQSGQPLSGMSSTGNGSASHSFGPSSGSPQPIQNGESRRRLHLPLSQGNGGSHGADPVASQPSVAPSGFAPGARAQQLSNWQHASDPGRPGSDQAPPIAGSGASGSPAPHREKEASVFIDRALRERVEGDITAFLAAFDAALADDTPESRTGLREATDRLLRAGARTRIELERLEARAPLPLRDKGSQAPPLFRR